MKRSLRRLISVSYTHLDVYKRQVGIREAGCVWAPEAVFDEEEQAFLVFFASKVKCDGEETAKHRIYAAYTKDFVTFSDTFLYMERERDVIDTTILRSNGKYYRISKDETDSRLILEESDSLRGDFKRISCPVFEKLKGMEGPEGYLLPEGRSWCVIADQFAEGKGYLPMITEDLSSGDFTILEKEKYDLGRTKKRHGGVLELSDAEYERLITVSYTHLDISGIAHFGEQENVVSVKVTHTDIADSRWYTGSGITRKVTLVVEEQVHPAEYGVTFVTEKLVADGKEFPEVQAAVSIHHEICNQTEEQKTCVVCTKQMCIRDRS